MQESSPERVEPRSGDGQSAERIAFDQIVGQTSRDAIAAERGWPGTPGELIEPRAEDDRAT
jgi:hypothetical protein